MDVIQKSEELTAHIGDPTRRMRVAGNLAKFMKSLDKIKDFEERDEGGDGDEEEVPMYQDDGTDGVPLTTLGDIEARETRKIGNLKELHRDLRYYNDDDLEVGGVATIAGPDINERGRYGFTALHRAVIDEELETVESLLSQGARRDIPDASGFTALDKARQRRGDSPTARTIYELMSA